MDGMYAGFAGAKIGYGLAMLGKFLRGVRWTLASENNQLLCLACCAKP
jgi:hypothetical protein